MARKYRNPGEEIGAANLDRVRSWLKNHIGGTQKECAKALGLSPMAVHRHVQTIRAEWDAEYRVQRGAA